MLIKITLFLLLDIPSSSLRLLISSTIIAMTAFRESEKMVFDFKSAEEITTYCDRAMAYQRLEK